MLTKTVCSLNHEGTKDTKHEQGEVKGTGQLCNKGSKSYRRAQILAARFGIRAMFGNNRYPGNLLPTYSLRSTAYSLRGWSRSSLNDRICPDLDQAREFGCGWAALGILQNSR